MDSYGTASTTMTSGGGCFHGNLLTGKTTAFGSGSGLVSLEKMQMLRVGGLVNRRKLAGLFGLGALGFLVTFLVVARSGSATQRPGVVIDFPPFEMVRVVTLADGHEAVFHFVWESQERWKETLVSTNRPVPPWIDYDPALFLNLGSYQQATDGRWISSDMVRPCETCPVGDFSVHVAEPDSILVPGVWFRELGALVRTFARTQADFEVSEGEGEVTVRVKTPVDIEEWAFDKRTGIPVGYRSMSHDGTVGVKSRATSVVLLSGEVVR